MLLSLFDRDGDSAGVRAARPMWRPECPIEQAVRCKDERTRAALVQEACCESSAPEDVYYVAEYDGLRILATCEQPLKLAVSSFVRRYGEKLIVDPPNVRYMHGRTMLEPWMNVQASVPERFAFPIESDFVRRRGDIRRLEQQGSTLELEGEAPLADLLGYAEWLAELTDDAPTVATRLSRYLPIWSDNGPKAA